MVGIFSYMLALRLFLILLWKLIFLIKKNKVAKVKEFGDVLINFKKMLHIFPIHLQYINKIIAS